MNTQHIKFPFREQVKNLLFRKKNFLGRVACLGKDVFYLKNKSLRNINLVNMQKCRADLYLAFHKGKYQRPSVEMVSKYIEREDIRDMIREQAEFNWSRPPGNFKYIVMDSYSELTDQLFVHKTSNQAFCANYSDIDHSSDFADHFHSLGLMEITDMEGHYDRFFELITKNFPDKTIYFLHFSCAYEEREKFRQRRQAISEIIARLSGKYKALINVDMNDSLYEKDEKDNFPYHYNLSTYTNYVSEWNKKEVK